MPYNPQSWINGQTMMGDLSYLNKSIKERIFHAVLFEVLANLLIILMMCLMLSVTATESAVLATISALTAMLWNIVYNRLFDAIQYRLAFTRTVLVRVIHAVIFEAGLVAILLPVAAWWLSISLIQAFFLELALVLFFLPYALILNWCYDGLRACIVRRHDGAVTG
ncbi:PACE efflux transporter [Erwinia mallotivora]|uniref:PACE efflux transporter n=1 Tax=Erwinia mallotivora TaxID=69222 RepID=UPI0021BF5AB2|nr:PACE efflux transporter [Erwinia mallotivora]